MMSSNDKPLCSVDHHILWEQVACGPKLAFTCGCVINKHIYIHGGVIEARSTKPKNSLYKYTPESHTWEIITCADSPTLSHHACIVINDRFMLVIGGWTGRERGCAVYAYDTVENRWTLMNTSGFPTGAGLSSHSAVKLDTGEILILGREGSLRTQRRSGNAFILAGSISEKKFTYKPYPLGSASRSGHTVNMLGMNLIVLGGRDDKLMEVHAMKVRGEPDCDMPEKLISLIDALPTMKREPGGRKNHSSITMTSKSLILYGGETFDGKSKEPVSDIYILDMKNHMTWKRLSTNAGRAGHICCVLDHSNIIIHGGIGEGNIVRDETFILAIH